MSDTYSTNLWQKSLFDPFTISELEKQNAALLEEIRQLRELISDAPVFTACEDTTCDCEFCDWLRRRDASQGRLE